MLRIVALLIVCAQVVVAQPDLATIVKTMKAREAASRPYFIDYEIKDERGGGTFWANTFTGWHYEDAETLLRRLRVFNHVGFDKSLYDQANYTKAEQVHVMAMGTIPLVLRKPITAPPTEWRGTRDPTLRPMDNGSFTPSQFGLVFAGTAVSSHLRAKSAKIEGRERVGEFDCVRVSLSWADAEPPLPLVLWLSEKHDYYPVRMVQYIRSDRADRWQVPEEHYLYDGAKYTPRSEFRVDGLERAGDAWLPRSGRAPVLFRNDTGTITYRAIRIVHGTLAPSKIDLSGITRAEVLDRPSGHTYIVGSRDGGVPKKGAQYLVPTAVQRAVGLKIAPESGTRRLAQYFIALSAAAAGIVWFLLWWRKQARAIKAARTGSGTRTPG